MKTHTYNGREFKNKADVALYIRGIMDKYQENEILSKDDFIFMMEILEKHQYVEQKVGCGIKEMRKIKTEYGNYCFQIVRLDGSQTDFSWTSCITPRNCMYDIQKACRESVFCDIKNFMEEAYADNNIPVCPITNQNIPKGSGHVHHVGLSFNEIFTYWVIANHIKPADIQIAGNEDGYFSKHFIDKKLSEDFRKYHNNKAKLIIVSKDEHLKLHGGKNEHKRSRINDL